MIADALLSEPAGKSRGRGSAGQSRTVTLRVRDRRAILATLLRSDAEDRGAVSMKERMRPAFPGLELER